MLLLLLLSAANAEREIKLVEVEGNENKKGKTKTQHSLVSLKFIVVMSGFRFRHGESLEVTIDWLLSGVYKRARSDKKIKFSSLFELSSRLERPNEKVHFNI